MVPGVRLVVLGKQGAGKGTQTARLARHYVVPHISTGDMFRAGVKSRSEFGRKAEEYMKAGELIPDDVVVGVVRERLSQDDTIHRGFITDGYPRTAYQAEQLSVLLAPDDIDLAVDIEVPTEAVLKRLASRRVCVDCGKNYSVDSPPRFDWTCDNCGGEVVHGARQAGVGGRAGASRRGHPAPDPGHRQPAGTVAAPHMRAQAGKPDAVVDC